MFATDEVVSEAGLRRAQLARKATAYTSWSDVPSPALQTTSAQLLQGARWATTATAANGNNAYRSATAIAAAVPPVALLSTSEDVRRAYPEPPASVLVAAAVGGGAAGEGSGEGEGKGGRSSAGGPSDSERKRARAQAQAQAQATYAARMQQQQQRNHKGSDSAGATTTAAGPVEPVMAYEKDYETVDYMGRTFLEPPAALVQTAPTMLARPCQPPQSLRGLFKVPPISVLASSSSSSPSSSSSGATGVQLVKWAPPAYGHLLFAANLQGEVRLWEAQGSRRAVAAFSAHTQPVKSLEVTTQGDVMSTGSVDGTAALWDVEAGACKAVLTNPERQPVVQHCHHPSNEDALVLVAVDRKVVLYDLRVSHEKFQREYTGHMGTIFNLTLLSGGTKFLTTAEDRTLRTWDFRIPVQIKQFADANMHAITHVVHHPAEDYIAAQSLDNRVVVFQDEGAGKLKLTRHKEFVGHTTSGTRCQLAFSHDGQYLSSGDIEGGLYIWRWSTGELAKKFPAHSQMLVSHQWHPLEHSRIVTGAWDGHIKNWV